MQRMYHVLVSLFLFAILTSACASSAPARQGARKVPEPLPGNPGNIFFDTQEIVLAVEKPAVAWELRDIDDTLLLQGKLRGGALPLGKPGPGWYKLTFLDEKDQPVDDTTLAVLEAFRAAVPLDSPICVDVAASWFSRDDADEQRLRLNLAALAGMNWVRDRMTWPLLMPDADTIAPEDTTFDTAATAAAAEDLQLLQTLHSAPEWARNPELDPVETRRRFPRDLRDINQFAGLLATRYKGRLQACEPWNEANITSFGGHLIDEMCSLQKAAWWGFKEADSAFTVCWNTYATSGMDIHHEGVIRNEAFAFFDTYNIHSYKPTSAYVDEFAGALRGASGRPLWLTECGVRVQAETEAPWGDLGRDVAIEQARFIPVSFATSIYAGVDRHFFFILGNYIERTTQFGVLRHDFTPRPGYVALATTGRMLAGARAVGRRVDEGSGIHLYAFRAKPRGQERDVIALWADRDAQWPLPQDLEIERIVDLYGRGLDGIPAAVSSDVVYVVLPAGGADALGLEEPPARARWRQAEASPVVLQTLMPQDRTLLQKQAYEVAVNEEVTVPVRVYNFGDQEARGVFEMVDSPEGWRVTVADQPVSVAAGQYALTEVKATLPAHGRDTLRGGWVTLRGKFGEQGHPVLAFRLAGQVGSLEPSRRVPLSAVYDPARWNRNMVAKASETRRVDDGGMLFVMEFPDVHAWGYPTLTLREDEKPPLDADGLSLTTQLRADAARVRVQFIEKSGATYVCETDTPRVGGKKHSTTVLFSEAVWRAATPEDEDRQLTPADIERVMVGINGKPETRVELWFGDLEWVTY